MLRYTYTARLVYNLMSFLGVFQNSRRYVDVADTSVLYPFGLDFDPRVL